MEKTDHGKIVTVSVPDDFLFWLTWGIQDNDSADSYDSDG